MSAGRDRRRDEAGRPHGRRHRHRHHRGRTPPHYHSNDSDAATRGRTWTWTDGQTEVSYPLSGTNKESLRSRDLLSASMIDQSQSTEKTMSHIPLVVISSPHWRWTQISQICFSVLFCSVLGTALTALLEVLPSSRRQ